VVEVVVRGAGLLVVILVAATLFGLWRRTVDGRLREVRPPVPPAPTAPAAPGELSDAIARPIPLPDDAPPVDLHDPDRERAEAVASGATAASEDLTGGDLIGAELGTGLGERATLVQFSSAFCQPCVATRRILGEVAGMVEGVVHVDIDAESHLELVRRLDIRRTPTVLILDRDGHIVRRASGAPRKADVIAALPL
jgi:thiol-disulfide isomerase/thioredoxin